MISTFVWNLYEKCICALTIFCWLNISWFYFCLSLYLLCLFCNHLNYPYRQLRDDQIGSNNFVSPCVVNCMELLVYCERTRIFMDKVQNQWDYFKTFYYKKGLKDHFYLWAFIWIGMPIDFFMDFIETRHVHVLLILTCIYDIFVVFLPCYILRDIVNYIVNILIYLEIFLAF